MNMLKELFISLFSDQLFLLFLSYSLAFIAIASAAEDNDPHKINFYMAATSFTIVFSAIWPPKHGSWLILAFIFTFIFAYKALVKYTDFDIGMIVPTILWFDKLYIGPDPNYSFLIFIIFAYMFPRLVYQYVLEKNSG